MGESEIWSQAEIGILNDLNLQAFAARGRYLKYFVII